jgi:hypothetical protein
MCIELDDISRLHCLRGVSVSCDREWDGKISTQVDCIALHALYLLIMPMMKMGETSHNCTLNILFTIGEK